MCGAIPPLLNTPSWCTAQLRGKNEVQGQLYFYLPNPRTTVWEELTYINKQPCTNCWDYNVTNEILESWYMTNQMEESTPMYIPFQSRDVSISSRCSPVLQVRQGLKLRGFRQVLHTNNKGKWFISLSRPIFRS